MNPKVSAGLSRHSETGEVTSVIADGKGEAGGGEEAESVETC